MKRNNNLNGLVKFLFRAAMSHIFNHIYYGLVNYTFLLRERKSRARVYNKFYMHGFYVPLIKLKLMTIVDIVVVPQAE